jgi:hypothetical protein
MESGTIVRWLKTEGDAVSKGEPLYELDTDKVTQGGRGRVRRCPLEDRRRGRRGRRRHDRRDHRRPGRGRVGGARGCPGRERWACCRRGSSPGGRADGRAGCGSAGRRGRRLRRRARTRACAGGPARAGRGRAREGEPARAPHRTRAGRRSRAGGRDRPRGSRDRGGRREGGAPAGCGACPRRGAGVRGRRAHLHPKDDRATPHGGVAGPRLPSSPSAPMRRSWSRSGSGWSSSFEKGRRSRRSPTS